MELVLLAYFAVFLVSVFLIVAIFRIWHWTAKACEHLEALREAQGVPVPPEPEELYPNEQLEKKPAEERARSGKL